MAHGRVVNVVVGLVLLSRSTLSSVQGDALDANQVIEHLLLFLHELFAFLQL